MRFCSVPGIFCFGNDFWIDWISFLLDSSTTIKRVWKVYNLHNCLVCLFAWDEKDKARADRVMRKPGYWSLVVLDGNAYRCKYRENPPWETETHTQGKLSLTKYAKHYEAVRVVAKQNVPLQQQLLTKWAKLLDE